MTITATAKYGLNSTTLTFEEPVSVNDVYNRTKEVLGLPESVDALIDDEVVDFDTNLDNGARVVFEKTEAKKG